jgi:hypothetical protein
MREALAAYLLALPALAVPASRAVPCRAPAIAQEAEKQAILQVIASMQEAWNRGDFRGYMLRIQEP